MNFVCPLLLLQAYLVIQGFLYTKLIKEKLNIYESCGFNDALSYLAEMDRY